MEGGGRNGALVVISGHHTLLGSTLSNLKLYLLAANKGSGRKDRGASDNQGLMRGTIKQSSIRRR